MRESAISNAIEMTLPMPANLGNARLHWRAKWRAKQDFYRASDERQQFHLVPAPPKERLTNVTVRAHFYLHNRMDPDNLHARMKHVLDWLVTRGYLVDDSPEHVTLDVQQSIERRNKRVELILEPA